MNTLFLRLVTADNQDESSFFNSTSRVLQPPAFEEYYQAEVARLHYLQTAYDQKLWTWASACGLEPTSILFDLSELFAGTFSNEARVTGVPGFARNTQVKATEWYTADLQPYVALQHTTASPTDLEEHQRMVLTPRGLSYVDPGKVSSWIGPELLLLGIARRSSRKFETLHSTDDFVRTRDEQTSRSSREAMALTLLTSSRLVSS
jgi:hypothetical protein